MLDEKMNTLSDRLVFALQKTGISQAELARKIGVKRQAIQYLCKTQTTKSKLSHDIAEALGINIDWLISGEGNILLENSLEYEFLSKQKIIPILRWSQIYAWLDNSLDDDKITGWTASIHNINKKSFCIKLKDNAMAPKFDINTEIIIDPNKSLKLPCYALIYINKIHEIVFRQFIQKDQFIILSPLNQTAYKEMILSEEDKILGCMTEAKWIVI